MIKKQIKEFMRKLGYQEEITDEMLDYVYSEFLKILESGMAQNALTFKSGCLLFQFTVLNQQEVQESLEDQVRSGVFQQVPKFKIGLKKVCLNLEEDLSCKYTKLNCPYAQDDFFKCEIVRSSPDAGLEGWA
ncbi:MAG: hypothetical protein ACFFD4_06525 [Candidatus Odinarchaeota archaeon]